MKLRNEEIPPNKTAGGEIMSMFQLKNLYNGARVPVTGDKDQLKKHFLTGMNMIIRDHTLSMVF